MPIIIEWGDESRHYLVRTLKGMWTWDEFIKSQEQINQMLDTVDHTVHQIIDASHSATIPPNSLTHFRSMADNAHPRLGKRLVVGTSNFYQSMYNILSRLFPSVMDKVILCNSYEKALEHIQDQTCSSQS